VSVPAILAVCEVCGKRFPAQRRSAQYCSNACRQRKKRREAAAAPDLTLEAGVCFVAQDVFEERDLNSKTSRSAACVQVMETVYRAGLVSELAEALKRCARSR
jgi:hypothetical protein